MFIKKLTAITSSLILSLASLLFIATPAVHAASATAMTDTWTGKGGNDNWSTAANWSNGVPQNGDNLVFDITSFPVGPVRPTGRWVTIVANNDLNNLSLATLEFKGTTTNNVEIELSGQPINLASGIISTLKADSTFGINVYLGIPVNLTANQTFSLGSTDLDLANAKSTNKTTLNLHNYSLSVNGNSGSSLKLSSTTIIKGTGTIDSNSLIFALTTANPNFDGTFTVNNGGQLLLHSANALGSSNIVIKNGGLLFIQTQGSTVTVANNIRLSGSGASSKFKSLGYTPDGAICASPESVKLTGQVTLVGNTTLGSCASSSSTPKPTTYTITKPVQTNGYTLTSASGSNVHIVYTSALTTSQVVTGLVVLGVIVIAIVLAVWLITRHFHKKKLNQAQPPITPGSTTPPAASQQASSSNNQTPPSSGPNQNPPTANWLKNKDAK